MQPRTIFITGAARGIGSAIAARYQSLGHQVVAPSRGELDLGSVDSIRRYLADHADLEVEVLINNAGENRPELIDGMPWEEWQRILTVNLSSILLLMQGFSPGMRRRKWGRIVSISSIYSVVSREGRSAYSASKAGLNALTRTAALEWGADGVLVNCVLPGFVATELTRQNNSPEQIATLASLTALKRLAQPEEIAELVLFLGSETNTYITGQALPIDGGFLCT
ncbi:MAG: SDR family NAD(P)-dependent oxidoreductase [Pirellulaceae bacterium]|nr:SDR family NAD(P)-dependent oxidoreductase [Pirellulaceae bacterium]